tara:strand:+ start:143 stop:349 length:207 start_codon:yes stop_codon:yes gene_type:complete
MFALELLLNSLMCALEDNPHRDRHHVDIWRNRRAMRRVTTRGHTADAGLQGGPAALIVDASGTETNAR